jgi:hypothetical protein
MDENEMTSALITALKAVNLQVPCIIDTLLAGSLPVRKQREFGGLLIALGELLREYADSADDHPVQERPPLLQLP